MYSEGPKWEFGMGSRRNTFFSPKMYTVCVVLLVATTYGGLGVNPAGAEPLPVGPVVSNNEWTPVVNSRRVYIDPQVLAKYRQQDKDEQEAAQDR